MGNTKVSPQKEDIWELFLTGINGFTEDFFEDGRLPTIPADRDPC